MPTTLSMAKRMVVKTQRARTARITVRGFQTHASPTTRRARITRAAETSAPEDSPIKAGNRTESTARLIPMETAKRSTT